MKISNYLYIGAVSALLAGGLVACEDDLEHYELSELTPTTDFALSESKVQIDEENLSETVLDLSYTKSDLKVTNGDVPVSLDGGYIVLQAAADESFSEYKTFSGSNVTSLKGDAINKMATDLGLAPNKEGVMYLRLVASYGPNSSESKVSNVAKLNVVPLEIDSHWAYIYTKDSDEKFTVKSAQYVFSPENDGKYQGFINAEPWLNFGVVTDDGTLYGTSEGTSWTFMSYMAGGDHFWLTAKGGCYYFTLDTKNTSELANAYLVTSLSCGGDVASASMVYDDVKSAWFAYIVVPKDNANVTISGTADHYQSSQDSPDETVAIGFSGTQNDVKFSLGSTGTGVTIPEKGTYKITLKLALNSKYKFSLEPAEVTVYPNKVTLNGNELTTAVLDGAATGVYTGFVNLKSGAQEIVASDEKDYGVKLEVAKDGWYMVSLDLSKKRAEAVLYGNTLTATGDWSGTLTMNEDGKYTGYLPKGSAYNFTLTDENGQAYGTYAGWDQYTFGVMEGNYDHLWLKPDGDAYIEIDPASHSWNFAYANALLVVSKQFAIGGTNGQGIRTTLFFDENTSVYSGTYDNTADATDTKWNYYLQGVNSTKDGFVYYGCDNDFTAPANGDNYAAVPVARDFADASDGHSFWVDPANKYSMTVDIANSAVSFTVLMTPTALSIYDTDKETLIAELTPGDKEGVFTGTLPARESWNFFFKGVAGDSELWYGCDNVADDNNRAKNLVLGSTNSLWADPTNAYIITVNVNDGSVTYEVAE